MQKESKHTKLKIISGYLLISLLSILSIVLIYKQITRLTLGEESVSNANQKLFIISNTITGLYEAEALSNAFIQTASDKYFKRFQDVMEKTEENIDSLKSLTIRLDQVIRIDSIQMLLDEKIRNLKELVKVKQTLSPDDFYSRAINSIESERDSAISQVNIHKKLVTTLDSSYIVPEKKKKRRWFSFRSEPDSVLQVTTSYQWIVDSVHTPTPLQNPDSVVSILKSVWQDLQEETQSVVHQINRKEYALINQSTHITDQLKRILREYEKEEINNSLAKIEKREAIVNTTTRIIAWIAAIAFLLIVFFIFFILRDLSRSQRYRKELEAANQYADQLLESREKMILTVTHDIKSPLSSIMGYIELLFNQPIDERQRYFLRNMKGSAEHILKLVVNLLDFSKLENNKLTLEEVNYNPYQLLQEIYDNFIPLATTKHLDLNGNISRSLYTNAKGDALRIRQIITNILSNAIKYTESGEVHFSAVTSAETSQMIITIRDTGPGMTEEEQKLIFKEFTRLQSNAHVEGTGLGLTITLQLIRLLQGEITLESEPGKGSCFTILLPLHPAGAYETPEIHLPLPAKDRQLQSIKTENLNVLLVDDDPLQLEMTANLLNNRGIRTEATTRPIEVTAKILSGQYHIIFTDIQMPGLNGFELIRQIRSLSDPTHRNIPIIALSANSENKEADYVQAGFSGYLSKPFTSAQLFQLIEKISNRHINPISEVKPGSSISANKFQTEGYTFAHIFQFTDQDQEATKQIIESFITETEKHVTLLENFKRNKQWYDIARLAHKMLPMFRQLEAQSIIPLLEQLEQTLKRPIGKEKVALYTEKVIALCRQLIRQIQQDRSSLFD